MEEISKVKLCFSENKKQCPDIQGVYIWLNFVYKVV